MNAQAINRWLYQMVPGHRESHHIRLVGKVKTRLRLIEHDHGKVYLSARWVYPGNGSFLLHCADLLQAR